MQDDDKKFSSTLRFSHARYDRWEVPGRKGT